MAKILKFQGRALVEWIADVVRNQGNLMSAIACIAKSNIFAIQSENNEESFEGFLMVPICDDEGVSFIEDLILSGFRDGKIVDQIISEIDLYNSETETEN